jgi:hypothetical protein
VQTVTLWEAIERGEVEVYDPTDEWQRATPIDPTTMVPSDLLRRAAFRAAQKHWGVAPQDIITKNRHRPLTWARFLLMFMLYSHTRLSLKRIGQMVGDRDHTSVHHGIRRANAMIEKRQNKMHLAVEDARKWVKVWKEEQNIGATSR